ncbi:hypothetical protein FBU30_006627 [Linnemannia zychae]|nr:hypothetical protein FBU30_006627 [Linnemannia zychae]
MANQSMMVPPNNTPWPGLQAPSHTQPPTSSPTYPHSHTHSHHTHTASYPPPSPYYHHPPPPPPHHPHHGPPPPPPPHYPYHPYAAAYPPPYGPSSSHSAYHHPPPHPSGHHPVPPPPTSAETLTSTSASISTVLPTAAETHSGQHKAGAAKSTTSSSNKATKTGKAGSESTDGSASGSAAATTSSSAPKTFRFEGSISSESFKTTKSFDLAGVNILNRKPLDARTALDKLQRRRETHNRVERKRRDCINQLIDDLTKLLPSKHLEEVTSKCHRVNVLRGAVAHINFLSESNADLTKTLDAAKSEGFKVPKIAEVTPAIEKDNTKSVNKGTSMDVDMADDVEADSVKREETDSVEVQMMDADNNDTPSRTSSPVISVSSKQSISVTSSSVSPRLTPSKILEQPQLIVTNASSPKTEQSLTGDAVEPPPISNSTASMESYNLESRSPAGLANESASPAGSGFSSSPKSDSSMSSSPPARPGSYQSKDNKQQLQQQLSPFLQTISLSTSPSLPPISSLACLKIQSPSAHIESSSHGEKHFETHPSSPMLRSSSPTSSVNKTNTHQRSGPTLPPLKIPAPQHLHPSYKQGSHHHPTHESRISNRSGPTLSPHQHAISPHQYQYEGDQPNHQQQQPPVSPLMLSPLMSRSPSVGPLSASSAGTSPYPHWGHENPEGPPHGNQYLPPHGYPHGYPYPYPYHPSYGYPHPPHGHPPPLSHSHHHHAPPSPHSPQQRPTSPYPPVATTTAAATSRPEPIFIQEEPWNVQRKRSTSNAPGKTQSGKQQSSKKNNGKEDSTIREESIPVSPTSSVASTASSYPSPNNRRKRPSASSHNKSYDDDDDEGIKRIRQDGEHSSPRLGSSHQNSQDHRQEQRDSGIVVVVVKADDEDRTQTLSPAASLSHHDKDTAVEHGEHRDAAAHALTTLSQNA